MFENFPVKVVDPLPKQIDPCPIVEAAFEIRFTTDVPWKELIGRVGLLIGDRYPERRVLDLENMPDQWKQHVPGSVHIPHYQFLSDQFVINLAPQMIGLCVQSGRYPGWAVIEAELKDFLPKILHGGFMREGARLGVRYTDFLELNIFEHIDLQVSVNGNPVNDKDRQFVTVFQEEQMTIRLLLVNGAFMGDGTQGRRGSVLDIDAAFDALDFELNGNVLERFTQAHDVIKKLFFGLVSSDLLKRLNPS